MSTHFTAKKKNGAKREQKEIMPERTEPETQSHNCKYKHYYNAKIKQMISS